MRPCSTAAPRRARGGRCRPRAGGGRGARRRATPACARLSCCGITSPAAPTTAPEPSTPAQAIRRWAVLRVISRSSSAECAVWSGPKTVPPSATKTSAQSSKSWRWASCGSSTRMMVTMAPPSPRERAEASEFAGGASSRRKVAAPEQSWGGPRWTSRDIRIARQDHPAHRRERPARTRDPSVPHRRRARRPAHPARGSVARRHRGALRRDGLLLGRRAHLLAAARASSRPRPATWAGSPRTPPTRRPAPA